MLKSGSKYYYSKLDGESRRVYNAVLTAWKTYDPAPSFKVSARQQLGMQRILQFIAFDNPELFYVDFSRVSMTVSETKAMLQTSFLYDRHRISSLEAEIKSVIAKILSQHKLSDMSDCGKELTFHDYLVENVSYANSVNNESTSVIGALLSHKAICEGYAQAFKLLCDQVSLPCIFVSGKAQPLNRLEERHAWNIVNVNGGYSHIDVTWDASAKDGKRNCYDHFNLTDTDISADHTWDRTLLPSCTSSNCGYYYKNNLCVKDLAEFERFFSGKMSRGAKFVSVKILQTNITQDQIMRAVQGVLATAELIS